MDDDSKVGAKGYIGIASVYATAGCIAGNFVGNFFKIMGNDVGWKVAGGLGFVVGAVSGISRAVRLYDRDKKRNSTEGDVPWRKNLLLKMIFLMLIFMSV